jgi:hypothetical protein
MYPHVTQFETARLNLERELQLLRELRRSHRRPPRHKLALLTWVGAIRLSR